MALQELRDELEWTSPAWEALDSDDVHASSQLPPLNQDVLSHQIVWEELRRRTR